MSDERRIAAAEALEAFKAVTALRERAKIVAYPLNGEPVDVTEEVVSILDMITSSMNWGSDFWSDDDLPAFITLCGLLNFAEMPDVIDYSQLPPMGRNLRCLCYRTVGNIVYSECCRSTLRTAIRNRNAQISSTGCSATELAVAIWKSPSPMH